MIDFDLIVFCIAYVLQVCAANFGEFCSIVGQEATEKLLVRDLIYFYFFLLFFVLHQSLTLHLSGVL